MSEAEAERDDLARFIGPNHLRLAPFAERRRAPFCWPGFLAPQAWFLYRKMYLWAALVSAGPLLIAYLPGLTFVGWGASLVGAFGLRLYLAHARATVARIRAGVADDAEAAALIARAGGVSRTGAALGLVFGFSAFVLSLKAGAPTLFGWK